MKGGSGQKQETNATITRGGTDVPVTLGYTPPDVPVTLGYTPPSLAHIYGILAFRKEDSAWKVLWPPGEGSPGAYISMEEMDDNKLRLDFTHLSILADNQLDKLMSVLQETNEMTKGALDRGSLPCDHGGTPVWSRSADTPKCENCNSVVFNGMWESTRKHHCRNCGKAVCKACSENTDVLDRWLEDDKPHAVQEESSIVPKRVCDECYGKRIKVKEMFAVFDQDGNGHLSSTEFLQYLKATDATEWESITEAEFSPDMWLQQCRFLIADARSGILLEQFRKLYTDESSTHYDNLTQDHKLAKQMATGNEPEPEPGPSPDGGS